MSQFGNVFINKTNALTAAGNVTRRILYSLVLDMTSKLPFSRLTYDDYLLFRDAEGSEIVIYGAEISTRRRKQIAKTNLYGGKGSVKEVLNYGDYEIIVKAFIQSEGALNGEGEYPYDELSALEKMVSESTGVSVWSKLLETLNVTKVVLLSFEVLSQKYTNGAEVEMKFLSDEESYV